jgi:hypothetical protein
LLVELLLELREALLLALLGGEMGFELLMELLHLSGQGDGALLAAAAFAAFALQLGGGSRQGRDRGAELALKLQELVRQGRLPFAWKRRRGGRRLGLGLGALEFLGGLPGLRELLFQLGAPGRFRFQRGGGLPGRGVGDMKLLLVLLEMSPGDLELGGSLTQALLQFLEAGLRTGWNRRCRGSPRRSGWGVGQRLGR